MKNPELSNLEVDKHWGLAVFTDHHTITIEGVCCDDHETNLSCIGIAAMERVIPGDYVNRRVSKRIISELLKEIKLTY